MSTQVASEQIPDTRPLYRSMVIVDLQGSTQRNNPNKGEARRTLYTLLEQALRGTGITPRHRERLVDRGDGVLVLVKPHDDVPKTVLIGVLIPELAALLDDHNATVAESALRLRLRAVVHAGEVHEDKNGFYGDDLDFACRLLDSPKLKQALKEAAASPLVLAVSEEIYQGIVQQGYLDEALYRPLCRVRVGNRLRRGWLHIPASALPHHPAMVPLPRGELPSASLTASPWATMTA
jgi:hypothetical protein